MKKKEAQCEIIVSHQLPITLLLTVHGLLCNNELRAIFVESSGASLLVCFSQISTLFKTGTSRSSFPLKSLFATFA